MVSADGSWLLRRVDEGPILRGLWLPVLAELGQGDNPIEVATSLAPISAPLAKSGAAIRHNITHRQIDVIPVRLETEAIEPPSDAWRWVDPNNPRVPTSSLLRKLVDALAD